MRLCTRTPAKLVCALTLLHRSAHQNKALQRTQRIHAGTIVLGLGCFFLGEHCAPIMGGNVAGLAPRQQRSA